MSAVAKSDLVEARLSAATGAGWLGNARTAAAKRVRDMGLPERRDEYWKFTRPDALTAATMDANAEGANLPIFDDLDCVTLHVRDGVIDAGTVEGASLELLSDIGALDIHWAKDLYGALETAGHDPVTRPLAALNSATATEGLVIHVTGKAAKPIRLLYEGAGDAALHHVIRLAAGAEFTLIESGLPGARSSVVIEAEIGEGAALHHIRTQGAGENALIANHLYARLSAEAQLRSFTMSAGGALTRNEAVIELLGDHGSANVAGATLGDGAFHHDDTVFVTHDAVHCESRQVFKKVLRNGATGVFQGKILVKPDAQKTDGYQISQSLLLDDDSQFLAKPELEIYADDVACSHGSTSGAIDEEALFYLRARGVPHGTATDLLTLAFLAEAVEEIADEALHEDVNARLAHWLEHRRS